MIRSESSARMRVARNVQSFLALIALFPSTFFLEGCHHSFRVYNNYPVFATNNEAQALKDIVIEYRAKTNLTPEERNRLQTRLMGYSDEHYRRLKSRLLNGRDWATFSAEIAGTTLSSVSALLSDVEVKSIISTASTLVQATKISIDKNFFAQQTTSALVAKMDANRAARAAVIVTQQQKPISAYDLEHALNDAADYDDQGTLATAIIALGASAGSDEKTQRGNLDTKREAAGPPKTDAEMRSAANANANPTDKSVLEAIAKALELEAAKKRADADKANATAKQAEQDAQAAKDRAAKTGTEPNPQ